MPQDMCLLPEYDPQEEEIEEAVRPESGNSKEEVEEMSTGGK